MVKKKIIDSKIKEFYPKKETLSSERLVDTLKEKASKNNVVLKERINSGLPYLEKELRRMKLEMQLESKLIQSEFEKKLQLKHNSSVAMLTTFSFIIVMSITVVNSLVIMKFSSKIDKVIIDFVWCAFIFAFFGFIALLFFMRSFLKSIE